MNRKRFIKALAWVTVSACSSLSASQSFAEAMPTEFLGRWMVYSDKSPNEKCDDAEGITVSNKRVDWSVESPYGKIDNVQRGQSADNVIVNMTCVDAEGWKNGKPRTSSDLSGCADLVVFQDWREGFYDAEFNER